MSSPKKMEAALRRIVEIQREIASLGFIARGTVRQVYKPCGTPGCHCRKEGDAGHGPYWLWTRVVKGRVERITLADDVARRFSAAIAEYQNLKRLLAKWEAISGGAMKDG
jgi:hypothetical protein